MSCLPDSGLLLDWYDRHRRTLPWRAVPGETPDPYRVWLSEIMLQQTTVNAVIPYFNRFLALFPTVDALAAAPADRVMAAWAGLGYYARARNLQACARAVAAAGGDFPGTLDGLLTLPGIGPYTARAIAAIAFGVPVIPVDGNVERVVSRLAAITTALPAAKKLIAETAAGFSGQRAVQSRAADFVQALFDLGATICTRRPACAICPWSSGCLALRQGIAAGLPARAARKPRPLRHGALFWLTDATGQVLLRRRPDQGLLGGMTELPGTAWRDSPWQAAEIPPAAPMPASWRKAGEVRHVFTHFELHLGVFSASVARIEAEGFLRPSSALGAEALPSVMRKAVRLALAAPA
jgi:A/G-specific adenine glycosylase